MVHLIIEYAASVWDPHTLAIINNLEYIQRTMDRFCYNDFSSVTDMLSSLNLPLLQTRRTKAKPTTFYKTTNEHLVIPTEDLIPKLSSLRNGCYYQQMTLI